MKKMILCLALGLVASVASAAGDPSSLKLKVFAVYASTSAQCTSPIEVFANAAPDYTDFLASPTLGGGDLPDGTYPCIIIKMSSIIKMTPAATPTPPTDCTVGTEYTGGVCNTGDSPVDGLTAVGDIVCTGDGSNAGSVDQTVYMYLTTDTAASSGNKAFHRPVTAGDGNGIKLLTPLVISSTTRAKFVVNASGQVVGGGGECGINAPVFSFANL